MGGNVAPNVKRRTSEGCDVYFFFRLNNAKLLVSSSVPSKDKGQVRIIRSTWFLQPLSNKQLCNEQRMLKKDNKTVLLIVVYKVSSNLHWDELL